MLIRFTKICLKDAAKFVQWTGPWQSYNKRMLSDWCIIIEIAMWDSRPCPGRSPYLFKSFVAGLSCNPCRLGCWNSATGVATPVLHKFRFPDFPVPDRPSKNAVAVLIKLCWQINQPRQGVGRAIWSTAHWLGLGLYLETLPVCLGLKCLYNQDRKITTPFAKRSWAFFSFPIQRSPWRGSCVQDSGSYRCCHGCPGFGP